MSRYSPPEKHSLTLRGHRTSVTLEPPFWRAFQELAAAEGIALNALAVRIDEARPAETGLASAIRVHVLEAALERPEIFSRSSPETERSPEARTPRG